MYLMGRLGTVEAAIVRGVGAGMDGSSFVAVQQWVHDLDHFQSMSEEEQDNVIGRRKSDNEELDEAPFRHMSRGRCKKVFSRIENGVHQQFQIWKCHGRHHVPAFHPAHLLVIVLRRLAVNFNTIL
jgi:hypothetical protein